MTLTEIEKFLQQGALCHGVSVAEFRYTVEETAKANGVTFAQAMAAVPSAFEQLPGKRQELEELHRQAQQAAAQRGCAVEELIDAYARYCRRTSRLH